MTLNVIAKTTGEHITVGALLGHVRRQLEAAGVEPADRESAWLIEHVLGLSGLQQVIGKNRMLTAADVANVQALVARRVGREPLQYILGTQEFCGLEFEVDRSVLIPRPETELLVRQVGRRLNPKAGPASIVVDVGTGSGCLAVVLARLIPRARVLAIDLSSHALETAKRNADRHGVRSVTWLEGDLLRPLAGLGVERQVQVIVSNPPYVAQADWATLQPEVRLYEPRMALEAGHCGTELHERLLNEAIRFLAPGGVLFMEVGYGQSQDLLAKIRTNSAYENPEAICDDRGIERVVIAERTRE